MLSNKRISWPNGGSQYSKIDQLPYKNSIFTTLNGNAFIILDISSNSISVANNGTNNNFVITDQISNKGLVYISDYSNNFTPESLVSKRYVTNAIITASMSGPIGPTGSDGTQGATGSTGPTLGLSSSLNISNSAGTFQIDMNDNKIINVASASNPLDAVNYNQLNSTTASIYNSIAVPSTRIVFGSGTGITSSSINILNPTAAGSTTYFQIKHNSLTAGIIMTADGAIYINNSGNITTHTGYFDTNRLGRGNGQTMEFRENLSFGALHGGMVFGSSGNGVFYWSDKTAFGHSSPSAKVHIISTTEQFRVGYDTSNYVSKTIDSTGGVNWNMVGSNTTPFQWNSNVSGGVLHRFINNNGGVNASCGFLAQNGSGQNFGFTKLAAGAAVSGLVGGPTNLMFAQSGDWVTSLGDTTKTFIFGIGIYTNVNVERFRINNTGVSISDNVTQITTPTASLDIVGGTASRAQIRLRTGISPTSSNVGDIWSTGTNLFFTRTGTTGQTIFVGATGGTIPVTNTIGTISDYYGTSATRVLTTPNDWAQININGTTYSIPLYL